MSESVEGIAQDTVRGSDAISQFINEDPRRTYYLLSKGLVPGAFQRGRSWYLLKSVYVSETKAHAMRATMASV